MGKFCGDTLPNALISTANIMKLEFVSDPWSTHRGFRVHYQVTGKYNAKMCPVITITIFGLKYWLMNVELYFRKTSGSDSIGI